MKLQSKKLMSLFLAMIMLFTVLPVGAVTVSAAGGVKSKLDSVILSYPNGSRWTGSFDGGTQCYGFAKMVSYKIFGTYNSRYRSWTYAGVSTSGMNVIGSITSFSSSNVKNLISKAKCGDVLQFNTPNQHSMIIYSVSTSNFKVYDCNSDLNCGVKLRTINFGDWSSKDSTKLTLLRADNYSTIDGTSSTHTHSYSGSYFETAHPHKVYKKCSCGKVEYTGATKAYSNCSTCMKLSTAYVMPIKAYTINTGKTTVYNAVGGTAKTNKIYDTDLCTISQIYDCGWCKVTFPLNSGGTETGYCKTSVFLKGGGYIAYTSKQINTYTRSDLKTSMGYAGSGDKIYILGNTSTAVQIAYPLTAGGWKAGWVPTSSIKCTVKYNANGGTGSMSNGSAQYNSTFTLTANKFAKTGYTFSGWNVYRSSDKKWYVSGQGWKTASEISSKGYTKKLYKNQWSGNFNKDWLSLGKTNDTYTFYAVWTPNKLSVNYNANGGTVTSDTYKISNNIIYKKSDNTKLTQTWTYNSVQKNGLYNASTFGLKKEGYTFKGWGTTAGGGTIFDQDDVKLVPTSINSGIKTGNCSSTLYAIWTPNKYTVKYDANGGTGAPAAQSKTYGIALKLSSAIPVRDGYEFVGWSKSKGSASAEFKAGANYTANSAVTLYAVWKQVNTPAVHTHEWNADYTVDAEPTCTETGLKSIHCKTCGETKNSVIIPVTEHSLKHIVKEASCTAKGEIADVCSECGFTKDRTEIPMLEHSFVSTVISEATCSSEGVQEDVCSECSLHINRKAIPMTQHQFGEWETEREATADSDGIESRKCEICGSKEERGLEYIPVYDEEAPRISVESVSAKAGDEVEIKINLNNNPGITALRLIVDYDASALTMTGFSFGEALASMNKGKSENYGRNYSFSMYSASEDVTDCGTVAIIKFKINDTAENGEYSVSVSYDSDDIFNLDGQSISFDVENGCVAVSSFLAGDVTGDGKVNMRDVVLLQQIINGWNVEYNKTAADYNGDGKINMRDIVALQQYING